mmetsp:Transcript_38338/g.63653  ORF Transcript_38338/g.63653 Transcript_38338/m.63653 type:complete len:548 (+) Transcript_38338:120-1763(+)|eukprot:CAMPEP_0174291542 /NCGR_PEP_ID=MMETSP0809-20121228/32414_1 /TAXON_ID=73025 ORGANISM="Eutreptiella gymnastica-like, Strain CCMP1594" /NCGR_SAMPLE_ID=MMETSP0809 /ASSEMBLY_ACC=CAM_ASM_000658 /LENGTH=547 /DNA_ID=CAMNT_0015390937 /DNA_START=92 /DNA_END=1735 /DNA_ORIENTATION=-
MAMQFTPQQMTGFAGYGDRTLIGNWSEDIQLKEDRLKSFVEKAERGQLLSQTIHAKVAQHTTPLSITPEHPDGYIHFDDKVVLQCVDHNGFLSVDLDDVEKVPGLPKKVIPTCASATQPMLRNVWRIVRVQAPDDQLYPAEEADVLHYNQPFKLVLNEQLCGDGELALHSEAKTGTSWSKISKNQEVTAVDRGTADLVWKPLYIDMEHRMEMEGMPVKANVAVILHHVQTNKPLCSQKANIHINDFGPEWEVCCFDDRGTGTKKRCLPELPPNHWGFITGPPAQGAPRKPIDRKKLTQEQASVVVEKVRTKLIQRGGNGFRGLTRVLTILDDNGNRKLDKYEIDNGLQTYGLSLLPEELDAIMKAFDDDGNGQISVREFMRALRGPMSDRRVNLVRLAYAQLDIDGNETVTFDEIRQLYDVKKHPDVLSHNKTPDMVLQEFISAWDKDGNATITFKEFCEYYEDLGAPIDNEDYFELMIRNAWHISGGTGVAANTSCRRVLVTHNDGTQTVEEIKNDIRMKPDDIAAMKQNLMQQGITDIKKIQLYS